MRRSTLDPAAHARREPGQAVRGGLLLLLCGYLLYLLVAGPLLDDSRLGRNHAVIQAQAWLEGRADIEHYVHDMARVDGRNYVIYPPAPSVAMLPLAALWGERTNTTLFALLVTLINAALCFSLLRRRGSDGHEAAWLTAALLFGTAYWFAQLKANEVYFLAHILAVAFALAALREFFGARRLWLVGLWVGLAFLSRQLSLYLLVFFALVLLAEYRPGDWRRMFADGARLGGGFAVCALALLAWNQWRFGDPFETGYAFLELPAFLQHRVDTYGLFSWHYLPHNAAYLFVQGPDIEFDAFSLGVRGMNPFGTSLLVASPYLLAALWARPGRWLLAGAWLAIGLCLLHQLLYYNNGWSQLNAQRFTLDFLPLLLLLCAAGLRHWPAGLWQGAILWAVALNALTLSIGLHQL